MEDATAQALFRREPEGFPLLSSPTLYSLLSSPLLRCKSAPPGARRTVKIEYPRLGLFRVDDFDQALVELRESMK